ncbi:hypothetical protein [Lolliginicoccus suaedae]|uniref:hypothetical protein n=1 Tax=Lolliginicoccus suaedae TaxID=2605429 RepID=UPI0011F01226|nr:hypothetical protein [Lolliginicoccus suaedae]
MPSPRIIATVALAVMASACTGPTTSVPAPPSAIHNTSTEAHHPQPSRVQSAVLRGYGSISILDPGARPSEPRRIASLPRLYASESGIRLQTGTPYGPHHVEAHSYTEEPRPHDPDSWEEAIHTTITAGTDLRIEAGASTDLPGLDLPLSLQGPGEYNVRLYARGRDANPGQLDSITEEKYLIQVWRS